MLLNLFFGWSLIGWVAALIWACTNPGRSQNIIVNNQQSISLSDETIRERVREELLREEMIRNQVAAELRAEAETNGKADPKVDQPQDAWKG